MEDDPNRNKRSLVGKWNSKVCLDPVNLLCKYVLDMALGITLWLVKAEVLSH